MYESGERENHLLLYSEAQANALPSPSLSRVGERFRSKNTGEKEQAQIRDNQSRERLTIAARTNTLID